MYQAAIYLGAIPRDCGRVRMKLGDAMAMYPQVRRQMGGL